MNIDPIDIVKKYLTEVRRLGINIDRAYLFGSYAKGNPKESSDIDMCVVSNLFGHDYFDEMVMLRKLAISIDAKIEPVPFTPSDLEDKYNTLASEIRKYGKTLL